MEVLSKWILCASLLVCIEAKIEDVYKDCGVTKGCYGFPENCTANSNCSVVMTYTGVEEQVYKVEVAGKGGEGDYVAMGLSLQPAMGNGTVMACTNKGIDSYWNNDDHKNVPQGDQPEISNVTHSSQDGFLICTFDLNATFSVSVNLTLEMDMNNPVDKPFNVNYSLNEESYHLMLAAGKLKTDGTIGYHTAGRDVDENPTVLAVFNSHVNNGVYTDCARADRGCWGFPDGCTRMANCTVAVSWVGVAEGTYRVKMTGDITSSGEGQGYLAVGFSSSGAMGPALAVACLSGISNGSPVQLYWNTKSKSSSPLDHQNGVISSQVTVDNNIINCEFELSAQLSGTQPGINDPFSVDLNTDSYHLLLANGPIFPGKIGQHSHKKSNHNTVVLSDYNEFFKKSTSHSPTSTALPSTTSSSNNNNFYDDCGKSKGCYGNPSDCISSHSCDMLTTYTKLTDDKFKFELIRPTTSSNAYVAVGLANDNKMADASVMACTVYQDQNNEKFDVSMYWNTGPPTGRYTSVKLAQPQEGLSDINAKLDDGYLVCTFFRDGNTTITPPGTNDSIEYVLNNSSYYLLLAYGSTKANGIIGYHNNKAASDQPVDLSSFSTVSPSPTSTILPSTTSSSNTHNFYDDCGKSKGCYGHPSDCVSSHSCEMLSTYTKLSDDIFKFELIRPTTTSNTYVAVGLSNDKHMADASVMACVVYQDQSNEKFDVSMYWNTVLPNGRKTSVKLAQPQEGLSDINAKLEDGYLVCTFFRDGSTTITPPGTNNSIEYVLNNSSYYLLLAYGPTKANGIIGHHDSQAASDQPVDLSQFSTVSSSVNLFVKFHGILMVLAWMGTANLGIFAARYARSLFPDKTILGKAVWFGIHQILMWLTVLLTVAGMTVIIVDKKLNPITSKVLHAMFGLTAVILSLIQPGLAAIRCDPSHKHRPVFNWVHRGVGVAALGLATVSIGLAVDLAELPEYTLYVMYVYIAWVAASHCGMTVMKMVDQGRAEAAGKGEGGSDGVVKAGIIVFSLGVTALCGVVVGIVAVNK